MIKKKNCMVAVQKDWHDRDKNLCEFSSHSCEFYFPSSQNNVIEWSDSEDEEDKLYQNSRKKKPVVDKVKLRSGLGDKSQTGFLTSLKDETEGTGLRHYKNDELLKKPSVNLGFKVKEELASWIEDENTSQKSDIHENLKSPRSLVLKAKAVPVMLDDTCNADDPVSPIIGSQRLSDNSDASCFCPRSPVMGSQKFYSQSLHDSDTISAFQFESSPILGIRFQNIKRRKLGARFMSIFQSPMENKQLKNVDGILQRSENSNTSKKYNNHFGSSGSLLHFSGEKKKVTAVLDTVGEESKANDVNAQNGDIDPVTKVAKAAESIVDASCMPSLVDYKSAAKVEMGLLDTSVQIEIVLSQNKKVCKTSDSSDIDENVAIDDCASQKSATGTADFPCMNDVNISSISHTSSDEKHGALPSKRGSEWIKTLQERTPTKRPHMAEQTEPPDSTKKKAKKNNHVVLFERILHSWQSNVLMWNHQMSVALSKVSTLADAVQESGNLSSKMITHKAEKTSSNTKQDCTVIVKCETTATTDESPRQFSDSSILVSGSEVKSQLKLGMYSPSLSRNCMQEGPDHFNRLCEKEALMTPPALVGLQKIKTTQNSMEVSPASSLSNSWCSSSAFKPPEKYLKLQVCHSDDSLPAYAFICQELPDETNKDSLNSVATSNSKDSSLPETEVLKKYLVFFALQEQNSAHLLEENDTVKIYAPWQRLDLSQYNVSVLFTSYFWIEKAAAGAEKTHSGLSKKKTKAVKRRKIILASWDCPCLKNPSSFPSLCHGGKTHCHQLVKNHLKDSHGGVSPTYPGFNIITEKAKDFSQKTSQVWTLLDAIERSAGLPDVMVALTLRIYRIIPSRSPTNSIDKWTLIGQDPTGRFAVVSVMNRPLVKNLLSFIHEGEGTTQTLTNLTISQRIINTQNPQLFSLLTSLHHGYQQAVQKNMNVASLLKDQAAQPPQSFCYMFSATLGQTEAHLILKEEAVSLKLPYWSLTEAMEADSGNRGNISMNILYKVDNYLYVTACDVKSSPAGLHICQQPSDVKVNTGVRSESKLQECHASRGPNKANVVQVDITDGNSLPEWLKVNGTIMQCVFIRDTVVWHGKLTVDEFSEIHKQFSSMSVTLADLLKIIPVFGAVSALHDIVVVEGTLLAADEDTAFVWEACGHCKSGELIKGENSSVRCTSCGNVPASSKSIYSLEVWITPVPKISSASVKIKLYQRTIERLLSVQKTDECSYDSSALAGMKIGPLICVVTSISKIATKGPAFYTLLELPY